MSYSSWLREVRDLAGAHGYVVQKGRGNHLRLYRPGYGLIFTSATPSDHRVLKNLRAQIRKNPRIEQIEGKRRK